MFNIIRDEYNIRDVKIILASRRTKSELATKRFEAVFAFC